MSCCQQLPRVLTELAHRQGREREKAREAPPETEVLVPLPQPWMQPVGQRGSAARANKDGRPSFRSLGRADKHLSKWV